MRRILVFLTVLCKKVITCTYPLRTGGPCMTEPLETGIAFSTMHDLQNLTFSSSRIMPPLTVSRSCIISSLVSKPSASVSKRLNIPGSVNFTIVLMRCNSWKISCNHTNSASQRYLHDIFTCLQAYPKHFTGKTCRNI